MFVQEEIIFYRKTDNFYIRYIIIRRKTGEGCGVEERGMNFLHLILHALSRYLCRLAAVVCLSRPLPPLRLKYFCCRCCCCCCCWSLPRTPPVVLQLPLVAAVPYLLKPRKYSRRKSAAVFGLAGGVATTVSVMDESLTDISSQL